MGKPALCFLGGYRLNEFLEKIKREIEPLIEQENLKLDYLNYVKRGKDFYLEVYVESDDRTVDFDEIVKISGIISSKLDEIDLIKDSYYLDVSTSGAEKEIKDLSKLPQYLNRYMRFKLQNPVAGQNLLEGVLVAIDDERLTIEYKVKARTKKAVIELKNILKANLAVKL